MIHRSEARFRVVDGGRRIGKSVIGGREAFAQLVIPGSIVWIVGPTMDLAEKEFRVVWRLAVEKGMLPVRRKSERELFIQCDNGSFIECRSEENPDQLIGEGLDLIVLAEAARLKLRTWDQYLRPALADRKGKALLTSTPRGFNWFYDFYNRGQDPAQRFSTWESWMIPSRMNPLLGDEEILEARLTSSPEAFAQEWEAKFIAYGGLVFPEFSQDVHVQSLEFTQDMQTALWIDPGAAAPYAALLVQITPEEEVHVLDEIYMTQRTTKEIIDIIQVKWGEYILDKHGHPRAELDVIVDKAAAEAAATFRLHGYQAHGEKPGIKKGIEVHHQFLRDPFRSTEDQIIPRILFDPKCFNCAKEHGLYHYPDSARRRVEANPSEVPVDIDNHTIDALRYGYFNTFPTLFNETPKSTDVEYADLEDLDEDIWEKVSLGDY
jgi:terminase large subunit-like protein